MAKSLAAIKSQIEKLQKQADSIQSNVIARIKREIAQHDLTADDLFGTGIRSVGNGSSASTRKTAKTKSGTAKPAKFADGAGNTWHGVGKRPGWIHEALEAGRKLEEFLIGRKAKPASAPKAEPQAPKAKKVGARKKPLGKKAVAAKKVPAAKKPVTAEKSTKAPASRKATKAAKPKATVAAPAAETPKT